MSRPRVWVARPLPPSGLEELREHAEVEVYKNELPPSRETVLSKVKGCAGLLPLLTDRIDATVMDLAGEQLRVIANYAVGYDNIDVAAATERGIWVTNTPDVLTEATADHAWALLMAAARRLPEGERYVRAGKWKTWAPQLLLGHDVYGRTLGIIGCGRIGQAVARRARGFGMTVLYHNRHRRPDCESELGIQWTDLDRLLAQSDFVSIHTPLTPATQHLIGAEQLKAMKKTAVLVNTARGGVVDPEALLAALRNGDIAAAALDVTEPEPPKPDDPLLALDNCLVVPHLGSATVGARTAMAKLAADNLLAVLRGETPPTPVNPEVAERQR